MQLSPKKISELSSYLKNKIKQKTIINSVFEIMLILGYFYQYL